jgi:hypothetical protein
MPFAMLIVPAWTSPQQINQQSARSGSRRRVSLVKSMGGILAAGYGDVTYQKIAIPIKVVAVENKNASPINLKYSQ